MMKRLLKVVLIWIANIAVMGAPVGDEAEATITNYEYSLTEDGYYFQYSTSNGIARREKGEYIKGANDDDNILRVTGSYSYTDEKGELHEISYGADETGSSFRKAEVYSTTPASAPALAIEQESERISPYEPKGISTAALASLSG